MKPQDLKNWRNKNAYSQNELAKVLNVDVTTISRWERGLREIPSFLHITLKCIKKKGGGIKVGRPAMKQAAKKNRKEVKI